jgi:hypothetical protein
MKRVVILRDTVSELLQDILSHQEQENRYLIICSTRNRFLQQLISSLSVHQTPAQPAPVDESTNVRPEQKPNQLEPHPLLASTLQLISKSRASTLAFCPTIDTLRAYLSVFTPPKQQDKGKDENARASSLLALDLISLHHATSEFSVQGLIRTLASAVEAAARNGLDLQLCECKDVLDPLNPGCGPSLWDTQVPLLSGSVRLRAEEAEEWSRRTLSVRSIAGRWFEFEKEDRSGDEMVDEDEGMLV